MTSASGKPAPVNRWGQVMPSPEWYTVRRHFPARSAIGIVDEAGNLLEILLLDPTPGCTDMEHDGRLYTAGEAEAALEGFVLTDIHGHEKQPWASAT